MILSFILQKLCHLDLEFEKNLSVSNLISSQFKPALRLRYVFFILTIEGDESYAEARILPISQRRSVFCINLVRLK